MFYKGIIFDLDNTLYNYNICHDFALESVFTYLNVTYPYIDKIRIYYEKIANDLKNELTNTASCHNKSIYFKHLLEKMKVGYKSFNTINNIYWTSFYTKMDCFDGVKEFIQWNKNQNIKIAVLTDYETEYQIVKLERLGLLDYIDVIITSEEIGKEKPSTQMFLSSLNKLSLSAENVIMIGDNLNRDIIGAVDIGIFSYWFSHCNIKSLKYISFHCFKTLLQDFISIQDDLYELSKISKYCGERFDLVQAGGGNTSVKTINDWLIIKSSGYNLTNIDTKNGYSVLDNKKIIQDIETGQNKDVTSYNVFGTKRASIETYMHSILQKYTVHLHPIQVNRILVCETARDIINKIYPNSLIIDYLTPGILVCNKIKELYTNQKVIFLLNHGIIVTSNDIKNIYYLIDEILTIFEREQNLSGYFDKYKFTNNISKIINNKYNVVNVSYLVEDTIINTFLINNKDLFKTNITFPDALVYCGMKKMDGLLSINESTECPKIIIENNRVYISANSLAKCKEIEDVLKTELIINNSKMNKKYLSSEETCFLNNWDSEIYRKMV
jgi:FMN phosphatase YigB (HAD superfamily)